MIKITIKAAQGEGKTKVAAIIKTALTNSKTEKFYGWLVDGEDKFPFGNGEGIEVFIKTKYPKIQQEIVSND